MSNDPRPQGPTFGPSHQIDMKDKRETIINDLKVSKENEAKLRQLFQSPSQLTEADEGTSTYHQHTHDDRGGRFAALDKQNISGSKPFVDALASPNWAPDPTGVEPPLGFSIDETPIVGEWHEIQASLRGNGDASATSSADVGAGATVDDLPAAVAPSSTILKRKL